MIDFNSLFELSRTHCVAICAALVPLNLMATSQTILLTFFQRSLTSIWLSVLLASLMAIVLILHVATWLIVGVIMIPTYVLFVLGTSCLVTNAVALAIASRRYQQVTLPKPKLS